MSKFISFSFLLLFVFVYSNNVAQISFTKTAWEDALAQAKEENKPIFIDFYTTWCGPCKILDKQTFQNRDLGTYMNEHFINLKYDAESPKFEAIAKKYEVYSFPTMLYFNPAGKLIHRISGIKTAEELTELNGLLESFQLNDGLQDSIANYKELTQTGLQNILVKSSGIAYENKSGLLDLFLNKVEENGQSWDDYEDIVMNNFDRNIPLSVLSEMIDKTPEGDSNFDFKAFEKQIDLKMIVDYKIREATKEKNLSLFEEVIKSFKVISLKTIKNPIKVEKDANKRYLSFYKKSEMKEEYAALATSMLEEYILPYTPEQVKEMEVKNSKSFMNKMFNIEEEEEESTFDKYKNEHLKGFQAGERLNDISKTFLSFFDDQSHLEKAKEWSRLSIEYFNHPKYYKNYSAILLALGDEKEAEIQILKGKEVEKLMEM